jgi:hypothetical protein
MVTTATTIHLLQQLQAPATEKQKVKETEKSGDQ